MRRSPEAGDRGGRRLTIQLILVLVALLLSMNAAAIWLRDRYQKRGLS